MKLHRLELTGFGPFRQTQVIDFDAFDRDGVFLISGRTGAGKSSILDGVSFALYGSVPRYDGGDRRLRSDHCHLGDPTEVRLEFTVGATRWRVTRAPEYDRPAQRGGGLTTEKARAELEELVDGAWVGRAAKLREVGLLLDEVLGLNAQQFQQVILLAQNKFSRFLLAGNAERQTLLRTLFGTRRFEQYKEDLEERRRGARAQLDEHSTAARTLLEVAERHIAAHGLGGEDDPAPVDDLPGRRDRVERAAERADYRVEVRGHERRAAEAAHDEALAVLRALEERARRVAELAAVRAELDRLDAETPQVAEEKARLERARAAEALRAPLEAAQRADDARRMAAEETARAERAWTAVGGDAGDDLAAIVERLTGDLARATAAGEQERDLAAAQADAERRGAAIAEAEAALVALAAAAESLPGQRARTIEELDAARRAADRYDDLAAARASSASALAAAEEAERLDPEVQDAERRHADATAAANAAGTAVGALLQRRLDGYAGELAAALEPGAPCAVCGGTDHPSPAPRTEEPVTDDDLAAAETTRNDAAETARLAGVAAEELRTRRAAARARAGGRDSAALATELAAADDALSAATAAQARAETLTAQLAELDALAETARAEADALRAELGVQREAQAAATATIAALRQAVEAARGEHATVADRIAADGSRRDAAAGLREARRVEGERRRAADEATADRDDRVAASGFADVAAVADALLSEEERRAADARIAEHAAALAAARARALELELETVADDVEEGAPERAAAAVAATEAARSAAIAAEADAVTAAAAVHDHLGRIDTALQAIAGWAEQAAVVTRLADTVAGRAPNTKKMDLETFVLAAELEEIVAAANVRLAEMSSGRYTLHHSDARQARGAASGLGIEVLDAHTGRLRSPQSLSGGETFLASLALALGLAEVVTSRAGGIRLDTLFIDEGFGSLDPETLELAMRTLDELRVGGRTVGVISHVEAMKEQLPAQIVVEATPEGPSVVRQDAVTSA